MKTQRNDYLMITVQTFIYGLALLHTDSQLVFSDESFKNAFALVMVIIGVLAFLIARYNRWDWQGHMMVFMSIAWTVISIKYLLQTRIESGWILSFVLSFNVIAYCIIALWRGDWRER